jgi:putative inorganic carbon (hco3(-)) transporter
MTTLQARTGWAPTPAFPGRGRSLAAEISVVAFFLIFYTNLAVVLTRVHGVPEIVASGFAFLLLVPLGRHLVLERQPLVVTPTLPLVFAFLAALFLAAALTSEPDAASQAVDLYITEGLGLYLLVSNAVRTTRMLTLVTWTAITAASLMGGLSLFQELTQTYANDYGGFAQVDKLAEISSGEVQRPRLGGPLGSENRYAQVLAVLLPLALIRFFREPSRRLRLAAGVASLLILSGIMLTFSRGTAVAVAATLVLMVLLREIRLRHLLVSVGVLTAVVAVMVPDYVVRLRSLEGVTALSSESTENAPDSALVGRQTENLAAWKTFLDHPVIGVGPGVYFREYSRDYANRLGLRYLRSERRGHSLYLEMAADLGIVGLGAFLAMVGTTLALVYRRARYWRPRDPERAMLASSFLFALFAYLASATFLHLSYQRFFWVLLALATSVVWALQREEGADAGGVSVVGGAGAAGGDGDHLAKVRAPLERSGKHLRETTTRM